MESLGINKATEQNILKRCNAIQKTNERLQNKLNKMEELQDKLQEEVANLKEEITFIRQDVWMNDYCVSELLAKLPLETQETDGNCKEAKRSRRW